VFLVQKAVSNGKNWRCIDLVLGVGKTTVLNRNMNVVENVESGQHVMMSWYMPSGRRSTIGDQITASDETTTEECISFIRYSR